MSSRLKPSPPSLKQHYAAGYGRPGLVRLMLDAGAEKGAKNSSGKTPYDLVTAAEQNPLNQEKELMQRLKA